MIQHLTFCLHLFRVQQGGSNQKTQKTTPFPVFLHTFSWCIFTRRCHCGLGWVFGNPPAGWFDEATSKQSLVEMIFPASPTFSAYICMSNFKVTSEGYSKFKPLHLRHPKPSGTFNNKFPQSYQLYLNYPLKLLLLLGMNKKPTANIAQKNKECQFFEIFKCIKRLDSIPTIVIRSMEAWQYLPA